MNKPARNYTMVTEDLVEDSGKLVVPRDKSLPVTVESVRFRFVFRREEISIGGDRFDRWSMPRASVYPDRGKGAENFWPLVGYYWLKQMRSRGVFDDQVQDTFILANLLTWTRTDGARKVLADSALRVARGKRQNERVQRLEELLAAGRSARTDAYELRARFTGGVLGAGPEDPEVVACHREMRSELLGTAREVLEREGQEGLRVALRRWLDWTEGVGRRAGHRVQKRALDILSCEARAAFHDIYSAVWLDLIEHLSTEHAWSPMARRFHIISHTQRRGLEGAPSGGKIQLFHRHVFALHPALDLFVATRTGSELVGDVLKAEPAKEKLRPPLERLLSAAAKAVYLYAELRQEENTRRRKGPKALTDTENPEG